MLLGRIIEEYNRLPRSGSNSDSLIVNDAEILHKRAVSSLSGGGVAADEFITDFEGLVRKYGLLSKRMAAWMAMYLLFNTISFTFFALATISYLVNGSCKDTFDYFIHII